MGESLVQGLIGGGLGVGVGYLGAFVFTKLVPTVQADESPGGGSAPTFGGAPQTISGGVPVPVGGLLFQGGHLQHLRQPSEARDRAHDRTAQPRDPAGGHRPGRGRRPDRWCRRRLAGLPAKAGRGPAPGGVARCSGPSPTASARAPSRTWRPPMYQLRDLSRARRHRAGAGQEAQGHPGRRAHGQPRRDNPHRDRRHHGAALEGPQAQPDRGHPRLVTGPPRPAHRPTRPWPALRPQQRTEVRARPAASN